MSPARPPAQLARPAPPGGRRRGEVPRHGRGGAGRPRARGRPSAPPPTPAPSPRRRSTGVRYVRRGGHYSIYPRALAAHPTADGTTSSSTCRTASPTSRPSSRATPVVNLVHHVHREQWPVVFGPRTARFGWWLESRLAPRVYRGTSYVAVSDSTKRELVELGVDADRVTIIHNGTDAVADDDAERSPSPRVVVLGRLVPQKRVEIALDAVAALRARVPGLHLDVVGSGWWEPHLREHVAAARARGRRHLPRPRVGGREAPAAGAGVGARHAQPQGGLGPRRRRGGRARHADGRLPQRRRAGRLHPWTARPGCSSTTTGPSRTCAAYTRGAGVAALDDARRDADEPRRPRAGCRASAGRTASTRGSGCCCARRRAEPRPGARSGPGRGPGPDGVGGSGSVVADDLFGGRRGVGARGDQRDPTEDGEERQHDADAERD